MGEYSLIYVYMLRCADGSLYTGYTTNLDKRLKTHQSGKGAKYTRTRLPVEVAYYEKFHDKSPALRREAQIKKLSKSEKEALAFAYQNCLSLRMEQGGPELLERVLPLWSKLNDVHRDHSPHFRRYYERFSPHQRRDLFEQAAKTHSLQIFLLHSEIQGRDTGYCVCKCNRDAPRIGEIDSLYIEPEMRGSGWGQKLIAAAIAWMNGMGTGSLRVSVAAGNEHVLGFYEKFGLYPKYILLENPDPHSGSHGTPGSTQRHERIHHNKDTGK